VTVRIAPSILSADFSRLGEQVREAIRAGADLIHVDVMDGHFVPNLTVGPLVVSAIQPICGEMGIPLDVHLMIENPERMIPDFIQAGSDILTIHVEVCPHLNKAIHQIRESGIKAGVSLNPATPLISLEEILPSVDQILVMSVNPGYGGQKYIPESSEKIARLRRLLVERHLQHIDIEVDGGIFAGNAGEIAAAGATILVAGSAVFNSRASIAENISVLRSTLEKMNRSL
jgi:ribulose-phosphate 3-epimerase